LTQTLVPLALVALLTVACCTAGETASPTDSAADSASPTADTQKGQDPMFGKKKPGLLAVGTAAPDFAVSDHEGNMVRLSDFSGKRVLLWFYPKADTPG
jgi:peroxiredoxin Q/BCP